MKWKQLGKRIACALLIFAAILSAVYWLQHEWAHRQGQGINCNTSNVECRSMLGWFTREDRLEVAGPEVPEPQPGDILVTLSTHSLGWRHGHAGLVIDENTILECGVWGEDSALRKINHWNTYSNYALLRVKGITKTKQQQVRDYALENLVDVPYHLSSGFIGPKAPSKEAPYFGLQCAYLVWYAWNHFDYDLDSDGGRLVTASDLLNSDNVEVVFRYGME